MNNNGDELTNPSAVDNASDVKPVTKSFVAAGMSVASLLLGLFGCCCAPLGVLCIILGGAGVFMGLQVKKAVNAGELHPSNSVYATVALAAGAIGIILGVFDLILLMAPALFRAFREDINAFMMSFGSEVSGSTNINP